MNIWIYLQNKHWTIEIWQDLPCNCYTAGLTWPLPWYDHHKVRSWWSRLWWPRLWWPQLWWWPIDVWWPQPWRRWWYDETFQILMIKVTEILLQRRWRWSLSDMWWSCFWGREGHSWQWWWRCWQRWWLWWWWCWRAMGLFLRRRRSFIYHLSSWSQHLKESELSDVTKI